MAAYRISYEELGISTELILADMGYGKVAPEATVISMLDELLRIIEKEVEASCAFRILEGTIAGPEIQIGDVRLCSGETINSLLKSARQFALFAATSGQRFEQLLQEVKQEGDLLRTYMMDTIGSRIAECAGDRMEAYLEEVLGGAVHSNRFSPGYCGWHLSEQGKLFSLLGDEASCGITLSDVFLMTPVKSISGLVGIGEHVSRKVYACHICELTTCYKRKEKVKQHAH